MSKTTDSLNPKGQKKHLENLLNVTTPNSNSDPTFPNPSKLTFKPVGQSDILSKVQAFLPQIKKANEELEEKDPSNLDIEKVDEDGQYIEMNLGLGVYDVKDHSDSADDDSDNDEGEDSEDLDARKLKIPNIESDKSSKKPLIEEM